MHLDAAPLVVVDTETTGIAPDRDRVIEIAAVKIVGGEVVGTFEQFVNPGRAVPRRITEITGISTAMVFDAPPASEVLPAFLDFLGDGVLVAHNLTFDHGFLRAELERANLPPLDGPSVCTLRLARRLLPGLGSHGLTSVARHYQIPFRARHRALGDAEVTAKALLHFLDRLKSGFGVATVDELVAFQHRRYRDASGEPKHVQKIRAEVLPRLPDRPGVYTFKRAGGEVLYVGKAKSLAQRVRTYFSAIDSHPDRLRKLVRTLRVVEWEETGTELAALLTESRRIKAVQPRFNRAQRRYRRYPYFRLDTAHPYPDLSLTTAIVPDGAEYYGPVGRGREAEEVLEVVQRAFGLRECDRSTWREAAANRRPCLFGDIGRCLAPCRGDADAAYADELARLRRLLTGDGDEVIARLETRMREAAERREYEQAGLYRDQTAHLRRLLGRQQPFGRSVFETNAVLVEPDARGGVQAFVLRFGRLVERLDLPMPLDEEARDRLRTALARHFDLGVEPPPELLRREMDEIRLLASYVDRHEREGRIVPFDPAAPEALQRTVLDRVESLGGSR